MTGFIKQPRNPQRPQQRGFGFGPFNRPNQFPNQFRTQITIRTG
ncbi:hypothetical protein VT84_30430 [Gemmata sp. SH-PL17]|nr:hypothetical protein VT84_30430 [Gemmata sp. SH-PL17]